MILRAILPIPCAACGEYSREQLLCPGCAISLYANRPACRRCAMPVTPGGRCTCRGLPGLDVVVGPYLYGGELATALRACKYRRRSDLAVRLGRFVATELRSLVGDVGADLVVPVPCHWLQRLRGGMDHAYELAVAARPGVPVVRALRQIRRRPRQAGLRRSRRVSNVKGSLRARHQRRLRGKSVVVFDDVMTTGATLGEAALALRAAGCRAVAGFAIARADD